MRLLRGVKELAVVAKGRGFGHTSQRPNKLFENVFGGDVAKATQSHSKLLGNQQFLFDLQSECFVRMFRFFSCRDCL
jgi:hypothetical protein